MLIVYNIKEAMHVPDTYGRGKLKLKGREELTYMQKNVQIFLVCKINCEHTKVKNNYYNM